jgi:signal transduction histidine kinase/ligand-binding sensor domain-containing protein/DNA-binding response OmpR family regulator
MVELKFGFKAYLFMLVLGSSAQLAVAQSGTRDTTEEFVIKQISVEEGLISNYVSKTISDADNLKYFATEGGISRYDGYSFKTYRPGTAYPQLLNENIETLFKDKDNNIWIGTKSGGLSMLDVSRDRITNFNAIFKIKSESQLRVMSLNQDARGYIWVGTWNNGVFVIDPLGRKVIDHFTFRTPILSIIKDRAAHIWFVAGYELIKASQAQYQLTRIRLPYVMNSLVEDTYRGKIWMVGNTDIKVRLLSVDMVDQRIEDHATSLQAKFVKSITIDRKQRIWLGSWGDGLFISDPAVSHFQHINTNPDGSNFADVNNSTILDIEIDENEIAWLGTAHGGVLMLYPNKGFHFLTHDPTQGTHDHNAIAIYKSTDNHLFLGTLAEGLSVKKKGTVFSSVASIPKTRINVIEETGKFLFIGTNKGLIVIRDRNFNQPLYKFPNEKITTVCLDRNHNLWIGTQQTGLKVSNIDTDPNLEQVQLYSDSGKGRYYLENNRINKIIEDKTGNIWLATYSGINRYQKDNQSFIGHKELISSKLPSVIINDLYLKGETMYLATPAGLIDLRQKAGKLTLKAIYDTQSGLINDFICAIEEDNNGNIWISSTTSLTRFDPFKKTFLNYDRASGLRVKSFHIGSSFKDQEGNIYFGGSNGLVQFNPNLLSEHTDAPHIVFTDIIVNNTNLNVGDNVGGRVLLHKDINYTEKLELGYKQNHLTLLFAANDFLGTDNVLYQYRMPGFQDEWINTRGRNEISFTGLNPGDYEVQIRASRDRQNWSEIRSLRIDVDVPPWATWYAYTLYALLLIGIGILINYVSKRQARLEAKLRIAEIEKEKEHDLNEAKISFFTNISHEFRTPLTLILSPVTEMLSDLKIKADIRNKMILVENNAKRLLNLINQLLDFRKSEYGLLQLNVERSEFVSFAEEVYLSFKDIARTKGITYKFETERDRALLVFDRDKMEIVLCNLISNAFKYSRPAGVISVRLYLDETYLNIEVHDNGIGLSPDDATKVFDRFYQVLSSATAKMVGSGIGLAFTKTIIDLHHGNIFVKSIPGKETCFTAQLLLDNPYLQSVKKTPAEEVLEELPLDYQEELHTDLLLQQNSFDLDDNIKKESVLIVDDNEDIRKYLNSLLQDDFRVLEAENGLVGLQIAKNELPDLIISDIMMPEMDGITFCQEIKSQIATSHIPIILLTARTSVVYEVNGLETGADDYVTKPFNPVVMKTRINNILENRRKLRSYFLNRVRFEPDKQTINEGNNMDEAFVEKAIKLVNDNISNESFGVDMLTQELYMSQSTLYRKIKSLTGLSITGFIRSVRLKKAAQLILNDNVKLSQVAYEVGFNDYKYFRLSFQQQFGCLPSDYKAEMLNNLKKSDELA